MAFRAPTAGALRHRVALQSVATAPASGGALAETYTTIAEVAARIETPSGIRKIAGANGDAQDEETVTHLVTIRWRSDWTAWRHLLIGTRRFEVRRVMDPDERRIWLELACEEMKEVG